MTSEQVAELKVLVIRARINGMSPVGISQWLHMIESASPPVDVVYMDSFRKRVEDAARSRWGVE